MRKGLPKILVTGGAGFIGSEFVRQLAKAKYAVIVVDKLTYAGDLLRLKEAQGRYKFYKADICDKRKIDFIFQKERPQIVVNFAASTHVDRSIIDAAPFIDANIKGTQVLLDISRKFGVKRLIHLSTDEVYGEISSGKFTEGSPLKPNSPYAASKAAADLLIKAYIRTYGFPAIIVRPCNNYGPWQYPEKFIPVIICNALKSTRIPVYAQGLNIREWLYVSDSAGAILRIMEEGRIGHIYNIGSGMEKRNIEVVKAILNILKKSHTLIEFVADRPGHDYRYSLAFNKVKDKLGWKPRVDFEEGLTCTVNWYKQNMNWLKKQWFLKCQKAI